ncbi:outer membrane protein [Lampropedia cohaerens]|uniref:Lipid A deacylase n=1 Tax=Lampropedia cohaerens TaxID=1610491 RepID=A0A0U1Q326_9BURK|nr:acyloxyacyl hydrolase [Lampropedia cohaerens]KKW69151.1 outer membrane protein [Lampropedia cohaerens]
MAAWAAVAVLCAPAAFAQEAAGGDRGAMSVQFGIGEHYGRAGLNYETPALWQTSLGSGWGRLTLVGEFGIAYWRADGNRTDKDAWQVSATPLLRWWPGASQRFYAEAGIGATFFSTTRFANKTISTAFQFGDHLGVGYRISADKEIGVRFSHFSNAGIKRPNPGLNLVQLKYKQRF